MIVGFNSDLFLRRPMTGIANYCFETIRAQQDIDKQVQYLGFTGVGWRTIDQDYLAGIADDHQKSGGGGAGQSAPLRKLSRTGLEWLAQTASRSRLARTIYRSARKRRFSSSLAGVDARLDLFHAFNFQPHAALTMPTLPVIYDLSFIRYPDSHPKERLRALETLPETIARAPLIQTISQFSKNEIIDVFGYPAERIFVAPPAAAAKFRILGDQQTRKDLAGFDLRLGSYFLAVGTLEPRKNIKTLITAYQQLAADDKARCPLVVVGGKGWGQLELPAGTDRLIQSGALRFVGSVSDAALRGLYEGAAMLLFPSVYEGFGMPVVEALACGTAVAHSSGTSMDEISGEMAVRVSAMDVQAWTEAMRQAISSAGRIDDRLQKARVDQAATFDWRRSAALALNAYRSICGTG
jgi:alpha-1,3-rhamnosyl/mannosyltransferase